MMTCLPPQAIARSAARFIRPRSTGESRVLDPAGWLTGLYRLQMLKLLLPDLGPPVRWRLHANDGEPSGAWPSDQLCSITWWTSVAVAAD